MFVGPRRRGRASAPRSSPASVGITHGRRLPRRRHDELAGGAARDAARSSASTCRALHERLRGRPGAPDARRARAGRMGRRPHPRLGPHALPRHPRAVPEGLDPAPPDRRDLRSGQRSAVAASGETRLRVLEPVHRAMGSRPARLAASEERRPGGAHLRQPPPAGRRLHRPARGPRAGGGAVLTGLGCASIDWEAREAPARRRRWFADGAGTLAVLLASGSDLDDLVPTLVACQLESNGCCTGC